MLIRVPAQYPHSPNITQKAARNPVHRLAIRNALCDIQGSNGRSVRAPQLLLRGEWLQRAGFQVGVPVKAHVSGGRLVIEPDHDRAPQAEILARIAQVTEGGLSKRDLDALNRRLKRERID